MTNLIKTGDFSPVISKMQSVGMDEPTIKKEISFAVQQINSSKQLKETTLNSRLQSVVNVANIGLTLNPAANEAYLISRWNGSTRSKDCTLMPSYIGLIKLIMMESDIIDINAQLVHKNDAIQIDLADNKNPVSHRVSFGDPGEIIGVYAIATLKDGTKHTEIMRMHQIEKIRSMSESYKAFKSKKIKSCVWVDHEGEMIRKTVIRRLIKQLPRTKNDALNNAIELDNLDYSASSWLLGKIESNIKTANISDDERDRIYRRLECNISTSEANDINNFLNKNQLKGVAYNGGNISMKELDECIAESVADPKK